MSAGDGDDKNESGGVEQICSAMRDTDISGEEPADSWEQLDAQNDAAFTKQLDEKHQVTVY